MSSVKVVLPFSGVSESCCVALRKNEGLYTQCPKKKEVENEMCKGCIKKGSIYGTTMDREAVGLMEYIDPKGNKVVPYVKIMKKLKITREEVLEAATSQGITVDEIHFEEQTQKRGRPKAEPAVKKEAGKKGRPRKEKPVIEIQEDNHTALFESLLLEAKEEGSSDSEVEAKEEHEVFVDDLEIDEVINEVNDLQINEVEEAVHNAIESAVAKAAAKAEAEKAKEAKAAAKIEADKAKAEAEKAKAEAKAEAEKAKAEAKAEAEKAKAEAKALAKAEADAVKAKAKALVKAEKAKAEAKAEAKAKEAKEEKPKKAPKKAAVAAAAESEEEEEEEEEEPDVVKKINFEGKVYLKSKKTGIIYDFEVYKKTNDQVVVGMWNEEGNCIIFQKEEEEEEEEDYEA